MIAIKIKHKTFFILATKASLEQHSFVKSNYLLKTPP